MGKYQGYDKYKDSGVEWLGDIPEHWEVKRLKNIASCNDESLGENTAPDYEIEYVDISSVDLVSGIKNYENMSFDKAPSRARRKVQDGDTIISTVRTYLKSIARIKQPPNNLIVSTGFAVIRPKININPNYIGYLLQSEGFIGEIVSSSVGVSYPAINSSVLISLPVVEPPLNEQEKIARFLDYKTKQIDDLIAKKETLIEKLDEKRTALISHAVTKGLDVNVPMKDSGIEWLGAIPQHWKPVRLKHITHQIIDGAHFTPTYVDDGIPFLRVTDIVQAKNNSIDMNNIKFIPKEEHKILSLRCKPKKGDLLYSKNGTIGVARIVDWDFDFSIFVSLCLIKVIKEKVNVEFLQYSLLGKLTETQINIGAKSNTVTNLHLDKIKEFLIALPTLDEQRKIIQYLDQKTAEIEEQKTKIQQAIDLLKEYRTALITNAVTGKIDVRKIPIPKI